MAEIRTAMWDLIKVAFMKQTYLNILYLLFSFPLGTAYFVFLVTGLSLGFGLLIVWIGIPVLILVFLAWWEIASFERQMAVWLLGIEIPPMSLKYSKDKSILGKAMYRIKSPVTWKALLFLLVKFPFGIFSLVAMISLVAFTIALIMSPLAYLFGEGPAHSFIGSVLYSVSGVFMVFVSLHIVNILAHIEGIFAKKMLGNSGRYSEQL
ncbi:sensor domain-containing protein [Methanolobus profundi]|uniref:Putative sensor n=1 Tax=Methanolobus profundi TaxID=487685 RepID=A0A1I4TV54_9EURY|nr:sensor domain-containing protein [Methanolobus profundi]SFM80569.1 Putative sensor [Methanolobus profundi]